MNIHWRRRRSELPGRPRRQRMDDTPLSLVLMLIGSALVTAATGLSVLTELEQFGPEVGGIIAFRPTADTTEWWRIKATRADPAAVGATADTEVRTCELSPSVMGAAGGSMVIEARRMSRPPVYRVHWAGPRTSRRTSDCGKAADLVLSRSDLMRLADVAGGFGNNLRMIGP